VPSHPLDYWGHKTLREIGNTLGMLITLALVIVKNISNIDTHICIYVNLGKGLSTQILLESKDHDWTQLLNYEHIVLGSSLGL
jgi:hypothetical protein